MRLVFLKSLLRDSRKIGTWKEDEGTVLTLILDEVASGSAGIVLEDSLSFAQLSDLL